MLGFSFAAFGVYVHNRQLALQPTYEDLTRIANYKEKQVEQWFTNYKRDLIQDLQNPQVNQAALTLLTTRIKTDTDYQAAYQFLVKYFAGQRQSRQSSFLLTQGGIVIFSTDQNQEGQYQPLQNTSTYVTLDKIFTVKPIFYQSSITQRPEITFVIPILDDKERRIGAFATTLNLEDLDEQVREIPDAAPGEARVAAYLVGQISRVDSALIAPNPQVPPPNQLGSSLIDPLADTSLSQAHFVVASPGIVEVLKGKRGNFSYLDYQKEPVLGVYRWLANHQLGLMVETDQFSVFREARESSRWIFFVGLALTLPLAVLLITMFKPNR
ncbi:MAG: hypothetical protein RLZZ568_430 [Cyanobacteriota bacterium]